MDNIGTALRLQGELEQNDRALEQAAAYRNGLAEWDRERLPQE